MANNIGLRMIHDRPRWASSILAWRELPRRRNPERFEVWLHWLLVNACYEELRRYRRWSSNVRVLPVA